MNAPRLDEESVVVSVIVPCRNGARHLPRLLASLVDQAIPERAEIIVVDNGSTDGSQRIARHATGRIPVRTIEATERASAAYARNVGADSARGFKLIFVDADDEVAPGYVAAISAALDNHP